MKGRGRKLNYSISTLLIKSFCKLTTETGTGGSREEVRIGIGPDEMTRAGEYGKTEIAAAWNMASCRVLTRKS